MGALCSDHEAVGGSRGSATSLSASDRRRGMSGGFVAWRCFEAGCLPDHPLVPPLVAAGLPDHPQPPSGAEIIDVADVRAVLPIYHGLTSYVGISGVPTAPDAARARDTRLATPCMLDGTRQALVRSHPKSSRGPAGAQD